MALVIVHKPGMAPRLGHTMGDEIESARHWRAANPGAARIADEANHMRFNFVVDAKPPDMAVRPADNMAR